MLENKYAILAVLSVIAIPVSICTFASSTLAVSICNNSSTHLSCASSPNIFAPFNTRCCIPAADSGSTSATVNTIPGNPVHVVGGNPVAVVNPGHTQATSGSHVVQTP